MTRARGNASPEQSDLRGGGERTVLEVLEVLVVELVVGVGI
jgi:hypothetical protein